MFELEDGFDSLKDAQSRTEKLEGETRAKVIEDLGTFYSTKVQQNRIHRVAGVLGPPGIGKSTLLSYLCSEGGAFSGVRTSKPRRSLLSRLSRRKKPETPLQIPVAAAHFFKHDDSNASSLRTCFLSIANQLCKVLPGFNDAIQRVQVDGISEAKVLFRTVLCAPLQQVKKPSTEMVIVLDALDEANERAEAGLLTEIVNELWDIEMPDWLGLIFSSRIDQGSMTNVTIRRLSYKSDENLSDLSIFLTNRLRDVMKDEDELKKGVEFIAQHANGFFVYADVVSKALIERGEPNSLTSLDVRTMLGECTSDLDVVYVDYFSRFLKESLGGDTEMYQSIFSVLAAARSDVDKSTFTALLKEEGMEVEVFFHTAAALLVVSEQSVGLPHPTMATFLKSKSHGRQKKGKELKVSAKLGHDKIVSLLLAEERSEYSLRHLVYHLCELKDNDQVDKYVLDFDWLHAMVILPGAARRFIDDLDAFYNYKDGSNPLVTDVGRALDLGLDAIEEEPSNVAFQLCAHITDKTHPILVSLFGSEFVMSGDGKNKLLPTFAMLEPARSALRKIIRGQKQVALDHETVLLGADSGTIELRDIRTWKLVRVMEGHCASVTCLALDGSFVVSGSKDGTLWVRERRTGACVRILETRTGWIWAVAIEGNTVVSGAEDNFVRVWDSLTGECQYALEGHKDWVISVAISGDTIVSGSADKLVGVWNGHSGKLLHLLEGHTSGVLAVDVAGESVLSGSQDKTVRVWDRQNGTCQHIFQVNAQVRTVSMDAGQVAAGDIDGKIKVWDGESGELMHEFQTKAPVKSVALEDDSLLAGCDNSTVMYWNLDDDTQNKKMMEEEEEEEERIAPPTTETSQVAISGNIVASLCKDSRVAYLWDAQTGRPVCILDGHEAPILGVAINESIVATCSADKTTRLWDCTTGSCLHVLEGHEESVTHVALDKDVVITGSERGVVKIWSSKDGSCLPKSLDVGDRGLRSIAVKGDVVALTWDHSMMVYNRSTEERKTFHSGDRYYNRFRHISNQSIGFLGPDKVIWASSEGVGIYDVVSNSKVEDLQGWSGMLVGGDGFFLMSEGNSLKLCKKGEDGAYAAHSIVNLPFQPVSFCMGQKDNQLLVAFAGSPVPLILYNHSISNFTA